MFYESLYKHAESRYYRYNHSSKGNERRKRYESSEKRLQRRRERYQERKMKEALEVLNGNKTVRTTAKA